MDDFPAPVGGVGRNQRERNRHHSCNDRRETETLLQEQGEDDEGCGESREVKTGNKNSVTKR